MRASEDKHTEEGPIHGGSPSESGFEPATLRSRGRDLTTRPPRAHTEEENIGWERGKKRRKKRIPLSVYREPTRARQKEGGKKEYLFQFAVSQPELGKKKEKKRISLSVCRGPTGDRQNEGGKKRISLSLSVCREPTRARQNAVLAP
ncbi:hypothetical protein AVEN_225839-1 [Araneus ventricosus]|uniref:Uncharacterized protein n=1 Tax=Araneus ventricosus TaxID=182803 RepID=A0A4Y2BDU9_ARAVE|nr:hypothetical protein AVEN_225839-1 [Araneus ventricosus]